MKSNQPKIARFADRLASLADDYRADVAAVVEDIKAAELDVPAVKRLASWSRQDPVKRAEREAIDEQYRFLAGETETPAKLPAEGQLAEAAKLYGDKLSVRQVAGVLKVSVGRAQKLRTIAGLFTVHVHADVNTPHHPATGEVIEDIQEADDAGEGQGAAGGDRGQDRGDAGGPSEAEHGLLSGRPASADEGGAGLPDRLDPRFGGRGATTKLGPFAEVGGTVEEAEPAIVGAVGPSSGRVASPNLDITDVGALQAMADAERTWLALKAAR